MFERSPAAACRFNTGQCPNFLHDARPTPNRTAIRRTAQGGATPPERASRRIA